MPLLGSETSTASNGSPSSSVSLASTPLGCIPRRVQSFSSTAYTSASAIGTWLAAPSFVVARTFAETADHGRLLQAGANQVKVSGVDHCRLRSRPCEVNRPAPTLVPQLAPDAVGPDPVQIGGTGIVIDQIGVFLPSRRWYRVHCPRRRPRRSNSRSPRFPRNDSRPEPRPIPRPQ